MINNYPYTSYTPYNRGATGNLTGGQVLTLTAANTQNKKAFIAYCTVDLYAEISNGNQTSGMTNPGIGSFRIPTGVTYGNYWVVPIQSGSEIRLSPVSATGSYSLVFLS